VTKIAFSVKVLSHLNLQDIENCKKFDEYTVERLYIILGLCYEEIVGLIENILNKTYDQQEANNRRFVEYWKRYEEKKKFISRRKRMWESTTFDREEYLKRCGAALGMVRSSSGATVYDVANYAKCDPTILQDIEENRHTIRYIDIEPLNGLIEKVCEYVGTITGEQFIEEIEKGMENPDMTSGMFDSIEAILRIVQQSMLTRIEKDSKLGLGRNLMYVLNNLR
jgi:hypothetical protein